MIQDIKLKNTKRKSKALPPPAGVTHWNALRLMLKSWCPWRPGPAWFSLFLGSKPFIRMNKNERFLPSKIFFRCRLLLFRKRFESVWRCFVRIPTSALQYPDLFWGLPDGQFNREVREDFSQSDTKPVASKYYCNRVFIESPKWRYCHVLALRP